MAATETKRRARREPRTYNQDGQWRNPPDDDAGGLERLPERTRIRLLAARRADAYGHLPSGQPNDWSWYVPDGLLKHAGWHALSPGAKAVWLALVSRTRFKSKAAEARYRAERETDPNTPRIYYLVGAYAKRTNQNGKPTWVNIAGISHDSANNCIVELQYCGLLRRRLARTRHGFSWYYLIYDRINFDRQSEPVDDSYWQDCIASSPTTRPFFMDWKSGEHLLDGAA